MQGIATDAGAEVFSGRYSLGSWVQRNVEWRLLQRPFDSELVAGVFDPERRDKSPQHRNLRHPEEPIC